MSAPVFDVAIIGGGTAGCAAALALRQRGMSVVLLDKGACGAMASGTNLGGVRRQGRMCGRAAAEVLAAARGDALGQAGRLRAQPPVKPIPMLPELLS